MSPGRIIIMVAKSVRLQQTKRLGRARLLVRKRLERRLVGRPRSRLKNNIKVDLREMVSANGSQMELAQDRV